MGRLGCWEMLLQFGECPLPNPPPRGREQIAEDSGVAGRLKKNARTSTAGIFQVAFIARQMEQTPQAFFFRRHLNPSVGCVPQGTHAVGWVCRENENAYAYIPHTPYIRATAFYFPCITLNSNSHPILSPRGRELERGQQAARLVLGRLGC